MFFNDLKFVRKMIVLVVCFSLSLSMAQVDEAKKVWRSFDYKQTLQFALENSPQFHNLKHKLGISVLEEEIAKAKLLPSFDLTTKHGVLDNSTRGAAPGSWLNEWNLAWTSSIYDNGVSWSQSKISSLNKTMNQLMFEDQRNKFILEILTQYINYSLSAQSLEVQNKQFHLVQKQYDNITRDYHRGLKTKSDYLRFKTHLSRSQIDLESAKSSIEKSKQELLKVMGYSSEDNAEIQFIPISLGSVSTNFSPSLSFENHLQFRISAIQKTINESQRSLIDRKNYPELSFVAGLSYSNSSYWGADTSASENPQFGWNATLNIKYNLFDWGIRKKDSDVAYLQMQMKKNEIDGTLLDLKSSISQLLSLYQQHQRNFSLIKELLDLEKSNLRSVEIDYQNGKAHYLDLVLGLNNLADAELKYYSAAANVETTRYQLLYHQGTLYEEIIKN